MRIPTLYAAGLAALLTAPVLQAENITLTAIRFPTAMNGTGGTKTPPSLAPLSQRIVFEFSGKPILKAGIADGVQIRVSSTNTGGQVVGQPAQGTYKVSGNKLFFTPRLPTAEIPSTFGPGTDLAQSATLPGLVPSTIYEIVVTVGSPNSIPNLKKIKKGISFPLSFTTVAAVGTSNAIAVYYPNAPTTAPEAEPKEFKPKNKTNGVWPNTFNDPAGLFSSIPNNKRPPFKLVFKGPVDPSADNIGSDSFRLRAILDESGAATDAVLGSSAVLTANAPGAAEILLYPEGILPFGHTVAVEVSDKFRALSGAVENPVPSDPPAFFEVARYGIALDPNPGVAIDEFLFEDFDEVAKQDTTIAATNLQAASWDALNSNVLKASFGFGGDGSLGRFQPPNPASTILTITLDTDFQTFPLYSGATPDTPPGTVVTGGVFNFSEFNLPSNVLLIARGNNPLVITVTGDCTIEGKIDLNGTIGLEDNTFDSGIAPAPGGIGGPGGGRGGDGHPVVIPSGSALLKFMQTPQSGGSGFGPGNVPGGGGGGGQSGCTMPWSGFTNATCGQSGAAGDGSRGAGGGGGSFNTFSPLAPEPITKPVSGRRGAIGVGNHLPIQFNAGTAIPGEPFCYQGTLPGNPTNAVARENPNPTFAQLIDGPVTSNGVLFDVIYNTNTALVKSAWTLAHRVLLYGAPGPAVFFDEDQNNNFIGPLGELKEIQGGQGGGAGGSRTEGLTKLCHANILGANFPLTTFDAKSGGAGGGGGAMKLQVLGTLTIQGANAKIEAMGGNGQGGEITGGSGYGGSGGGGSGGCVVLQSATNIVMNSATLATTVIDVSGGCGVDAAQLAGTAATGTTGGDLRVLQVGDSGPGGPGIVQFHIPETATNLIDQGRVRALVFKSMFNIDCTGGTNDGRTPINPTVDMSKTPTPLTPQSTARSTWYDLGAVTSDFRPPLATPAGMLAGPLFGNAVDGPYFQGTDPNTGVVLTNAQGFVLDPFTNDIEVDSPDLQVPDFIPQSGPHYQSVIVRFQGADEDADNPGSPDLDTATAFVPDIRLLNGRRFVRWEIEFDIATNVVVPPQPTTPLPQVNFLRIPFKY